MMDVWLFNVDCENIRHATFPNRRVKPAVDGVMQLVDRAVERPDDYPLLSGVDEYWDTYFNPIQCRRLETELNKLRSAHDLSDIESQSLDEVLAMAHLLATGAEGAPDPRDRQAAFLVFVGD